MMPGMDGFAVARELRKRPEFDETVLVFLSGCNDTDEGSRSPWDESCHHMRKPFDLEQLRQILIRSEKEKFHYEPEPTGPTGD